MLSLEKTKAADDAKWTAVLGRDRSADGTFYYSVKTTGVYCKPSCAGRPKRENVAFHATREEAERARFRPCKRCRPDEPVKNIAFVIAESAFGSVAIAASEKGVCAILFGRDANALRRDLEMRFPKARISKGGKAVARMTKDVLAFLKDPRRQPAFALDMEGTAFQRKVWQALRGVPAGWTASYAEIAKKIGEPSAVRAVAQACSANRIAVAIPCHRVVGSDGSLSGYRWGAEKKRALLAREAA